MLLCRSGSPLILACMLAACSGVENERANAPASTDVSVAGAPAAWGCDEPEPGHPTAADKREFLEEVGSLATRAEQQHGVPAAAITAMAILESGYGWTRLAQNTNNVLGWKYFAKTPAGEREVWVLECPERGTSDQFLVFRDRAEAVGYVAEQLASSDNYREDTERYRRDRASGVDVTEAVDRWVDGIADPYSSQPEAYRAALRRLMSEPYKMAEGSSEHDLYSLSEAVLSPPARSAQALGG